MIEDRLRQRGLGSNNLVWENVEAGGSSGGRRNFGQRLVQPTTYNTPQSFGPGPRINRNFPNPLLPTQPNPSLEPRSGPPRRDTRPLARRIQGFENVPLEASPTPLLSRVGNISSSVENPELLPSTGGLPPQYGYDHVPEAFWYHALGLAPEDPDWHRVVRIEHNSYYSQFAREPPHRGPWTFPQLYRRFLKRHSQVWPMVDAWRNEMRNIWRGHLSAIPPGHSWHRDYFYVDGVDKSNEEVTEADQDWLINVMHTGNARRDVAGPIIERFQFPPRFIPAIDNSEGLHVEVSDDEGDALTNQNSPVVADDDSHMNDGSSHNSANAAGNTLQPAADSSADDYEGTTTGSPMRSEDARAYD